ncbi:FadR/GntR family transcriptional regulator [Bacillus piscicola]|uniref:FadR/GntR family transcriptional regulator n=1 Tax=Bacillus piscicola TaxID=1632684 RepID=UPI001F09C6B9|nr:FCD domain-containing protein [Bacillus piscicola]
MIKKTNRLSLVEQVASQIEQLIEAGHWAVGERIPPEMELMERFDVSRNTLREAIRALVHAGLLTTKQGSGTVVRSASALGAALERHVKKANLLETLEVRVALEKQAAAMAAERRTDDDLVQLRACIKGCQAAAGRGNQDEFITADIAFHEAIAAAAHNQLLVDLYEPMTDRLYTFIREVMELNPPGHFEKELHLELLEAIEKQDKAGAAAYVERYMNELQQQVTTTMEE